MEILVVIGIIVVVLLGLWFFRLFGYRDGVIRIELDDRYSDRNDFILAVKDELEKRGMNVRYKGDANFIINDVEYMFQEINHPIAGIPVQRALLEKIIE
ncbi:hypothetical protein [Paucisalibacillus sp. EB02]|uniref:hypothetical protein n=1 Tax=Paucisalibacillus sp. EB02 TaxID=1347087 RepID=UPI0005AB1883|nr:hypothetical protein [Paucisalibacillus sp. EB02]